MGKHTTTYNRSSYAKASVMAMCAYAVIGGGKELTINNLHSKRLL